MRIRCAVFVGLIALAACGSSSGRASQPSVTSAPPAGRCGPAGAATLAADRLARVYQSGGNVYGCAVATRRSFLLGASARSIREGRAGPVALAGTDVAYGYTRYGVDTVSAQVIVRELRGGGQLRNEPATIRPLGPESFQSVSAVVVKAGGAIAWIGLGNSIVRGGEVVEVAKTDAHGRALLDSGTGIDHRSLRLHGSMVTWRHGGATRSARLY